MPEFGKVLTGLLLWMGLLQHVMTITTVNLEKKGVIYAANITNAHTTLKLTIDKGLLTSASNDMLLVFYGHAFTFYDIKAGEKDDMKLVCSGADWTICVLNLNDQRPYFNGFRGYQVEINLNEKMAATFSFAVEDHIVGYIGLPYTIIGNSLDTVKMRLMGSNDQSFDKLRFEFVALTTTHHADKTSLSAVGNFGMQKSWPSAQQHDFSLQHLHGTEIAGVFDDQNPHFCTPSSKCDYKFEIKAQNAHTINLNSNFARKIEDLTDNVNFVDRLLTKVRCSSSEGCGCRSSSVLSGN